MPSFSEHQSCKCVCLWFSYKARSEKVNIDVFSSFESLQCNVQTPADLLRIKCLLLVINNLLLFYCWEKNGKINWCIADDCLSTWNCTILYLLSRDLLSHCHRMNELERSHKILLVTTDQLNVKLHQVENANMRVKGKLRDIREDLINLVRRILFQMTYFNFSLW